MYLFGSRGLTMALYALAVMFVIGMGFVLFRMMFAKPLNRGCVIPWAVLTGTTMLAEILYSELEIWRHHNGMAGAWIYLWMPFFGGFLWLILAAVIGRRT